MRKILDNKSGKGGANTAIITVSALVILGLLGWIAFSVQQTAKPTIEKDIVAKTVGCPDTKQTTATISVENPLNSTGTELFNTTLYLFGSSGEVTKVTNTGTGTATLTCGESYVGKIISTDGASGDSSSILSTSKGSVSEGNVNFDTNGQSLTLTLGVNQRGVPEIRAKDIVNDGFMFDDQDYADAKDYETTDGVQFFGITNNTGISVGSGGELHIIQYVRANLDDNNFNDKGVYVLIDAASSVWSVPTLKIDGNTATESSNSLSADEKIAYNAYEYVYFIPSNRDITKNKEIAIDTSIFALGGINPTGADNISIDFAVVGQYESTQKLNTLKTGAVKDDSSKTQVYTLFDTVIVTA